MLTAIKGYYNGTTFVFDEDIDCEVGQEVILTFLDKKNSGEKEKREPIDFSQFVIPYERGENGEHLDAQEYVRRLRDNDRI